MAIESDSAQCFEPGPARRGRHRAATVRWRTDAEFDEYVASGAMVEPGDELPAAYRDAVFRFIELHANSELMGALTERDWIPRAPGLRHKLSVLAKTQDEIGHAHLLYMVAADMGVKNGRRRSRICFAGRTTCCPSMTM